ncbi:hypothetical protein DFH08DRAFT_821192, partial [Mycena albidolilacea]
MAFAGVLNHTIYSPPFSRFIIGTITDPRREKRLGGTASASGASDALKDVIASLAGKRRGRKAQRIEIWQQRNAEIMKEALRQSDFDNAMGVSDEEETTEERQQRIRAGKREQMAVFRRVRENQFAQA